MFFSKKCNIFNKISILLALSVFLVICGLVQPGGSEEKKPLKIGYIGPMTGPGSSYGLDMEIGAKIALEELNYTMGGRKVELIIEDDANNPANTVVKVRKLITQDKVDVVTGIVPTSSGYAAAPILAEAKVPWVVPLCGGDDLTQRKRPNNIVRLYQTSSQVGHPAADYAYNHLGWRTVNTIGWEMAYGFEVVGGFHRAFEEAGGKVIKKLWTPMTTMDFAPYVAGMDRNAGGLLSCITAAPSMRFVKAFSASGLNQKLKHIGMGSIGSPDFLAELKDSALGMMVVDVYFDTLDNPANKKFVAKVKAKYNREVSQGILLQYDAIRWIAKAAEMVKGDTSNFDKWMGALRSVELKDSPRGPMKLDKYGQVVENVYISEVRKVDGMYKNVVVHTYPMVSQFWKYNPEEFLKKPVYDRDNPPCKNCK